MHKRARKPLLVGPPWDPHVWKSHNFSYDCESCEIQEKEISNPIDNSVYRQGRPYFWTVFVFERRLDSCTGRTKLKNDAPLSPFRTVTCHDSTLPLCLRKFEKKNNNLIFKAFRWIYNPPRRLWRAVPDTEFLFFLIVTFFNKN